MNDPQEERIRQLAEKWLNGTITPEEAQEYAAWYNHVEEGATLEIPDVMALDKEAHRVRLLEEIRHRMTRRVSRRPLWIGAAAASVLLCIGVLVFRKQAPHPPASVPMLAHDALPGKSGATLTLSNGQTILLDTAQNGQLAAAFSKAGEAVTVRGDAATVTGEAETVTGQAATAAGAAQSDVGVDNLLSTPKARQQQLVLADGTRVWLDAESSIRFPSSFGHGARKVEVTGQAFFDVAQDPAHPFMVQTGQTLIKVLGTSFNIMAYPEEDGVRTTLIEGAVRVCTDSDSLKLSPGEQSVVYGTGGIRMVKHADPEVAVAWKNGVTAFDRAPIAVIMRQVSRWYDVDIEYQGDIPTRTFTGEIPRTARLSELLRLFELSKIHFTIDGPHKKLIVMP